MNGRSRAPPRRRRSTWSPASVARAGGSALAPPSWTSAISPASRTPPRRRAVPAGRPRARRCARPPSGGSLGLGARSRGPPSAPTPSTAVCTTISNSPTRSRPAANDSPTRRSPPAGAALALELLQAGLELARHRLNSLPSAPNSSLPSAGTFDGEVAAAEPLARRPAGAGSPTGAARHHREDEREHQEAGEARAGEGEGRAGGGSAVSWSGSAGGRGTSPPIAGASNEA